MSYYKHHLYFCTNLKDDPKKCCQRGGNASEMCQYTKKKLIELGLHGKDQIRVSSSGCMGRCSAGPSLVVYPEQVWYRYTSQADIDLIIEKHLQNGDVVTELLMQEQ